MSKEKAIELIKDSLLEIPDIDADRGYSIAMAGKSLMKEMLPMKISNWESIEYSEGLNCPNENCDNKSCSCHARNIIGWCDTPYGYMMVCECKKCFTKYRFHGTIEGKFDFENFADNFLMRVEMEKGKL
jgi:hypothetical protein